MVLRCFYHMIADNLTVKIYPTVTVTCIKFTGLVNTSVRYNKITKKKWKQQFSWEAAHIPLSYNTALHTV